MKLDIQYDTIYLDSVRLCFAGAGNQRTTLPKGIFDVSVTFSHAHGCNLPKVEGVGWIGPANGLHAPATDIVLGRVRDGAGKVLGCHSCVDRLLAVLEAAEDRGQNSVLKVTHD